MISEEYFRPGVEPADIPAIYPLLRAHASFNAFTALFRGSDDDILIRLLVLREIGLRGEQPLWSPQDLRTHFAYLDDTKLQTVLHRLRETDLLVWNPESSLYQISPQGRMALSAIAVLLKFSEDDGGEIGYITSQLAAGQATGVVAAEDLQHLLSRLNELQDEFSRAVVSGSELRIRRAETKLASVLSWVEKGTEIMKLIAANPDLDPGTHRVAQKIGQVQSRMLRMSSVFQRTLNQLDRQNVHLGQSGLSTADIHRWFRMLSKEQICDLLGESLSFPITLGCLLGDVALDVAENEFFKDREEAEDTALPPPLAATPTESLPVVEEDLGQLRHLLEEFGLLTKDTPLENAIPSKNFAVTSYRLSLASLLGDPQSAAVEGMVSDLARLPLVMCLNGESIEIKRCQVERMSAGIIRKIEKQEE